MLAKTRIIQKNKASLINSRNNNCRAENFLPGLRVEKYAAFLKESLAKNFTKKIWIILKIFLYNVIMQI